MFVREISQGKIYAVVKKFMCKYVDTIKRIQDPRELVMDYICKNCIYWCKVIMVL